MTEPLRAAHLFATNGIQIFTHIAPHISRIAEFWQDNELWKRFSVAVIAEIEEVDGAMRHIAAWEYDQDNARWTRFEKTETGETLHYQLNRLTQDVSQDQYIVEGAKLSA